MTASKKLGIWMDHASAHIIAFTDEESVKSTTLESEFTSQEKEDSLRKSEHLMHNKEQHLQAEFYKKLGEVIKGYDEVLLFGPTDAKSELWNTLKEDFLFKDINIEIQPTDKMTEKQEYLFVQEHFSKK